MLSEEVEDEILALESIYDSLFTRTDVNYIRAVITPAEEDSSIEHGSVSVLYLEATLPPDYPELCTPTFSLDNLNNSHWSADLKQQILSNLQEQATEQLGTCCLYTVIEWAREQLPGWLECLASSVKQHDTPRKEHVLVQTEEDDAPEIRCSTSQEPAEEVSCLQESQTKFMSKAQKRRHYDRFGATNEKPRGHDWIDIVAHLARR